MNLISACMQIVFKSFSVWKIDRFLNKKNFLYLLNNVFHISPLSKDFFFEHFIYYILGYIL